MIRRGTFFSTGLRRPAISTTFTVFQLGFAQIEFTLSSYACASQTEFEPHVTGVDLECGAGRIWRALQTLEAKDVQSEIFAVQFLPSCRLSQKRLYVSPSRYLGCLNMPSQIRSLRKHFGQLFRLDLDATIKPPRPSLGHHCRFLNVVAVILNYVCNKQVFP